MDYQIMDDSTVRVRCDVDLKSTFECGQCFRFDNDGIGYTGVAFGKAVRFVQGNGYIDICNTDEKDATGIWGPFLNVDFDYSRVTGAFPDDEYLKQAAEYSRGLHILKQDVLETVISFIISSNNNIKRIKGIIQRFCELYGKPVIFENQTLYTFPDAEDLKSVTFEGVSGLRAGFRDRYIMDAVDRIRSGNLNLDELVSLPTSEARNRLMEIKGVGLKVADCILLFGLGRYEVFPKDVWIKRVLSEIYGTEDDNGMFGDYGGIVQQYLFNFRRNGG